MTILLPNLINNFSEGIHRTKCKLGHDGSNIDSPDCVNILNQILKFFFWNIQTLKII